MQNRKSIRNAVLGGPFPDHNSTYNPTMTWPAQLVGPISGVYVQVCGLVVTTLDLPVGIF